MKIFFMSDIHGSFYYAQKAIEAYKNENADYIVILGDELYHGPRNPLPKDYDPMKVVELLNKYSDKIIAVRGNCDPDIDEMLLDYNTSSTFSTILYNNKRLFLTHGHIYNEDNLPKLSKGDVFIYGHTHILKAEKINDIYIINPGSISLPKENNLSSYGILESNAFKIKALENGNILKQIELL